MIVDFLQVFHYCFF